MILLNATAALLQVVSGSTLAIAVHASWVDVNGTTITPGCLNTLISTGTTTTVVGSPGSGTSRNIKHVSIANTDASASESIIVQHNDGSNVARLIALTLKAGYTLTYNDLDGWVLLDGSGGRCETPLAGRYLGSTLLTSASANFTTSAQTNTIRIRGVGGGGGGAGCTSVAAACAAGGGGGAGSYAEKIFTVTPNTAYAYTCGALGAGASGALGGTGGNSTFVVGATTVTCNGGVGAPVATAATTLKAYPGGAGGGVSTNGDVNTGGAPGGNGVSLIVSSGTAEIQVSGEGGSSPFGGGGAAINTTGAGANGNNATGFGAGGSGSCTGASQVRTGGSGTAGCWVVDEYS